MCYGHQEYFTKCHDPGNFIITDRCDKWTRCTTRVEERTINVPGECPKCRDARAVYLPRGDRPQVSSRWRNLPHLEEYYYRKLEGLRRVVEACQAKYNSTGRRREWIDLQCAVTSLRDAEREYHKEVWAYRVEEARLLEAAAALRRMSSNGQE